MTEIVYLTLSHFNRETRNYFLNQTGYSSLLDYELSTENRLFEISWNTRKNTFVVEISRLENPDKLQYFSLNVPLSSLSYRSRKYLYSRFLTGTTFKNFEEYYINNAHSLPNITVYVPYKFNIQRLNKTVSPKMNLIVELRESGQRIVSLSPKQKAPLVEKKQLSGFTFSLNKKTKNSYILYAPEADKSLYSHRYGRDGWELFDIGSPVFYRVSLGGFVVSKKYYSTLIEKGAIEK